MEVITDIHTTSNLSFWVYLLEWFLLALVPGLQTRKGGPGIKARFLSTYDFVFELTDRASSPTRLLPLATMLGE